MAALGSLVIQMAVDTAKFQGDLGRAATVAEARMRGIRNTAEQAIGRITAVGVAAAAAIGVALKAAVDRADDMRDLAAGAGVSTEQLSRLGFAAKQSGVDLDIVAKALAKLSNDGIPNANAELYRLADVFAKMPDGPEKTALAVEKFGERIGPGLIPLLNEGSQGLQDMADQADALGVTIRTNTAEAADQFNDKIGELKGAVQGIANQMAADLLPTMNDIADAMVSSATSADNLRKSSSALGAVIKGLVDVGYTFYVMLDGLAGAVVATADAAAAAAKGNIAEAKRVLLEENARQIESERRLTEFTTKMWDERVSAAEAADRRLKAIARQSGQPNPVLQRFTPEPKPTKTKGSKDDPLAPIQVYGREMFNLANAQADAIEQINREAVASNADFLRGISNETFQTVTEMDDRIAAQAKKTGDDMTTFAQEAARNIQDAFAQFLYDPFKDGIKGMLAGFIDMARKIVAEIASQQILKAFFTWGSGLGGGVGSFFGSMLSGIGARAAGGPVGAGKPYIVGERGPELFVPSGNGMIIPNGGGAGAVVVNYSIDARGADADRIMSILPVMLKQTEDRTIARVRELQTRGRM